MKGNVCGQNACWIEDQIGILPVLPKRVAPIGCHSAANRLIETTKEIQMKKKTIFIHAGFHKTGTSTIQQVLFDIRESLATIGDGYFYSSALECNHSIALYSMFSDHPKRYPRNIKMGRTSTEKIEHFNRQNKDALVRELESSDCRNIIFSGEDISRLETHNLIALKTFLNQTVQNCEMKVILWTREPVGYIASLLQESLKSGAKINENGMYRRMRNFFQLNLEKFIHVFGRENICVQSFEDACKHPLGLTGFFLKQLNLNEKHISTLLPANERRLNVALNDKVVHLFSFINTHLPLLENGKINEFRALGDTAPLHKIRGNKFQLTRQTVDKIDKISQTDRLWLKEQFGINYSQSRDTKDVASVYDGIFRVDILRIFPKCTPVIQFILYQYLENLCHDTALTENSQRTIKKIIKTLQQNYPDRINGVGINDAIKKDILSEDDSTNKKRESF